MHILFLQSKAENYYSNSYKNSSSRNKEEEKSKGVKNLIFKLKVVMPGL